MATNDGLRAELDELRERLTETKMFGVNNVILTGPKDERGLPKLLGVAMDKYFSVASDLTALCERYDAALVAAQRGAITPALAAKMVDTLNGLFVYLSAHGFTTPISEIVVLMNFLRDAAAAKQEKGT